METCVLFFLQYFHSLQQLKTLNMSSRAITIAYAEDHDYMRETISGILTGAGFHVIVKAKNGKELIDQLKVAAEPPDICLLDVSMPVLDGYATAIELTQKYMGIKILALSMNNQASQIVKMLRCGACCYVVKDCETEEIISAIKAVYNQGFILIMIWLKPF